MAAAVISAIDYVKHDKPKQLFARELSPNARRSLQAEHLKPALAVVEKKTTPGCYHKIKEIQALSEHFKAVPEYRKRYESYPIWSLLTLILLAMLCDAPRGQKDLAKFARRLTQAQRRVLGFRENPQGRYPAPGQSTFSRLLKKVDGSKVNETILAIQEKLRGKPPQEDLIVVDGKEPKHGAGDAVLSAVTVPSQVLPGQRDGRCQDQRNTRGAPALCREGTSRAARGLGRAPHPEPNRARFGY